MPDTMEQARLTRRTAGLFHPFPREILAVRGKDRAHFLHRLLSHDIRGLAVGQGRPACLLDRQGKILFSCTVIAHAEELLLEMAPGSLPAAREQLQKYLVSEAVEIQDATALWKIAVLKGPAVSSLLAELPGISGVASDWTGLPGFTLWMKPSEEQETLARLEQVGRKHGLTRCGAQTFEVLRIEAGVPRPSREINPSVILNELGEQAPVSFTKGCYIGQEIVARIQHRAHPPRLLTGFLLEGTETPSPESPILLKEETVGVITSACFSPSLDRPIALGFLKYGTPPNPLQVGSGTATPTPLPFV